MESRLQTVAELAEEKEAPQVSGWYDQPSQRTGSDADSLCPQKVTFVQNTQFASIEVKEVENEYRVTQMARFSFNEHTNFYEPNEGYTKSYAFLQ